MSGNVIRSTFDGHELVTSSKCNLSRIDEISKFEIRSTLCGLSTDRKSQTRHPEFSPGP